MMVQITIKVPEKIKEELVEEWEPLVNTYPTLSDYMRKVVVSRHDKIQTPTNGKPDESRERVRPFVNQDSAYDSMLLPIFEHVKGEHLSMIDSSGRESKFPISKPSDVFKAILSTIKFDFT